MEADQNTVIEVNKAIYVVYPDETANNWRVQAVPVSAESFESRKALPEAWRGLRDEELSKVSGIEGGIFIHASGFIGGMMRISQTPDPSVLTSDIGNKTKDGALKIAQTALTM